VVTVAGALAQCQTVVDSSECGAYHQYYDGACTPTKDTGVGACSAYGVRSGAGGVGAVDVFVLFLALAVFGARRRGFA
jgi:hypothetical protein